MEQTAVIHPHVECRPGVQGGTPVIRGTRFPVASIVQNYRRGLTVDQILREFPSLSPAQVFDALSFYHDHREQIDAEIARLRDVETAMRNYPPTLRPGNGAGSRS